MGVESPRSNKTHAIKNSEVVNEDIDQFGFKLNLSIEEKAVRTKCQRYEGKQEAAWSAVADKRVLPSHSKLKKLVRKGIPPGLRAWVWMETSGGARIRASHPSGHFDTLGAMAPLRAEDAHQIELDLPRTFPTHPWLSSPEGLSALRSVLVALSNFNPDVGYCQGMNFVAAIMLLATGKQPETAFWLMVALLSGILYPGMYSNKLEGCRIEVAALDTLMQSKLPALSAHLNNIGCTAIVFAIDWFLSIFAVSLPSETAVRAWDALFLEGHKVLFRVSLAILKILEPSLLSKNNPGEVLRAIKQGASHLHDRIELLHVAFNDIGALPRSQIRQANIRAARVISPGAQDPEEVFKKDERANFGSKSVSPSGIDGMLRNGLLDNLMRNINFVGRAVAEIPVISLSRGWGSLSFKFNMNALDKKPAN